MQFDMEALYRQQKELHRASDDMTVIKRQLQMYQSELRQSWKSAEEKGVDDTVERTIQRMARLSARLDELGHQLIVTGEHIKEEEETNEVSTSR